MFFMMGITPSRKDFDFSQMMICQSCGAYGRYTVYMTCTVLSLFFIPVLKWGRRYFAESSCCGQTYELNPEIGREIAHGGSPEIRPEDLTPMYQYSPRGKRCTACGYTTAEDFSFCPKCGRPF